MASKTVFNLQQFRELHGLTQAQLAELLPVSLRTLQDWESKRQKGKPAPYLWRALRDLERELKAKKTRPCRYEQADTHFTDRESIENS
ncbi:MAG TPA: helix-turn-helix domain-containing protein [Blastocatellia bacterium]|nr:helix-turn-helix domain-containing protein [Blastocatellia bacterium]HMX27521.1 helix-turn-helix domain-containing protein [Blastocatellia bacterium]HMY73435.1 helix-turn-helix domain-containing protein [Blastocatellia bacterium]HMZ21105.1 helix-turn-helix domain-containing protein [Blastocatellia bacterium]HNG34077.1 helix-turn-helix domain-containing protein [Blastocatellia bacterium]